MLSVVWETIVEKRTLKSLTVRFPSDRIPSPVYTVPGIPFLKSLTITDIDPLNYPDNLQVLLHESHAIEHLTMHWSPRMRRERETSTNLHMYFGKIYASNSKMKLKSIAFQNLYCLGHTGNFLGLYDPAFLEQMTQIDSTGGADDDANMSFVVEPPKRLAPMPRLRIIRGNKVSRPNCDALKRMAPLKKYFLLSGRELREDHTPSNSRGGSIASPGSHISDSNRGSLYDGPRSVGGTPQSIPDNKTSPSNASNPFTAATTPGSVSGPDAPIIHLGRDYMDNVFRFHGPTLTHLLLLPQWRLSPEYIRRLTLSCVNLQEVGIGVEDGSFDTLQAIVPNMRKLTSLRILDPPESWANLDGISESMQAEDEWYEEKISDQTYRPGWLQLKWLGLGNKVFELLGEEEAPVDPDDRYEDDMDTGKSYRRRVARRPLAAVMDTIEIWKMDQKKIVF
jgi:hypothetical protein